MNWLAKFVRSILGDPPGPSTPPRRILVPLGSTAFSGPSGTTLPGICGVSVSVSHPHEATAVPIRFRVESGPALLGKAPGSTHLTSLTSPQGKVEIDVTLTSPGCASISAVLETAEFSDRICFRVSSEEALHTLELRGPAAVPAGDDGFAVTITASDFRLNPVSGARLVCRASLPTGKTLLAELHPAAAGSYRASFATRDAGPWRICAFDPETGVTAETTVRVEAGKAARIRLVDPPDPRESEPYGEVVLRARLEDIDGNALDPARIECRANGITLDRLHLVGEEAWFRVRSPGYSKPEIALTDRGSGIAETLVVPFAAVWLRDPGLVQVGQTFTTPLYALPPADRPASKAEIEIRFDPEQVAFTGLEPSVGGPLLACESRVDHDTLILSLTSDKPLLATDYPGGIPIREMGWQCKNKGKSWFSLTGRMSPSTPAWELCVDQKIVLPSCVCVNFIYHKKDTDRFPQSKLEEMAGQLTRILNNGGTLDPLRPIDAHKLTNLSRCCPYLITRVHFETINQEGTGKIWDALDKRLYPEDMADAQAIFDLKLGHRDNCINIFLWKIANRNINGFSIKGAPGDILIDPDKIDQYANLVAHEMGHALGLDDIPRARSLMNFKVPHGDQVSREECQTIWANLGSYPCL